MTDETTSPPPAAEKKQRRLPLRERSKALAWLEANRETAILETSAKVAELAAAALGFEITAANIVSLRKEAGIFRVKPVKPENAVAARLEAHEIEFELVDAQLEKQGLRLAEHDQKLRELFAAAATGAIIVQVLQEIADTFEGLTPGLGKQLKNSHAYMAMMEAVHAQVTAAGQKSLPGIEEPRA